MSANCHITIDGKPHAVHEGVTVLEAARSVGIAIPTLCHLEGSAPHTSCMLCLVEDVGSGKLFPSCSVQVTDGMIIRTQGEAVFNARRTALNLLLSDHGGECEAPCQIACPAGINIPKVLSALQQGEWKRAYAVLMEGCPDGVLQCESCKGVCVRACRRSRFDESLDIRRLMLEIAGRAEIEGYKSEKKSKTLTPLKYKHRLGEGGSEYHRQLYENCGTLRGMSFKEASKLTGKQENPVDEATRCLLCGCVASENCRLRLYADEYGADRKSFEGSKSQEPNINMLSGAIIHEPSKCIQCGICVRLTQGCKNSEAMGYAGRGFMVQVSPVSAAEGKAPIPTICVEQCPTGALGWKDRSSLQHEKKSRT